MSIFGINYPTLAISIGLLILLVSQFVAARSNGDRPLNQSGWFFIGSGIGGAVLGFADSLCLIIAVILTLLMGIFYLYLYFSPDDTWPSGGGHDLPHTDGLGDGKGGY